jgi:hypothetical protein
MLQTLAMVEAGAEPFTVERAVHWDGTNNPTTARTRLARSASSRAARCETRSDSRQLKRVS